MAGQKIHFSQSLADRLYTAEFDDALADQIHWKNPRYEGCKLTGKKINEYHGIDPFIDQLNTSSAYYLGQYVPSSSDSSVWGGDISYGLNPVINNETTAIYIANTVVGGIENERYATLEGHSYVGISKILIVNMQDNTVKVIDRETEPYDSFHRFITQDFPTGAKLNIKVLDPAIQSDLEGNYSCRMNKGWLLSTFKYLEYDNNNTPLSSPPFDSWDGGLELFDNSNLSTVGAFSNLFNQELSRLSFRFGIKTDNDGVFAGGVTNNTFGVASGFGHIPIVDFSPNYTGATIVNNKFIEQYYNGDNTFPTINTGGKGAFLSASRFILNDTVNFLTSSFATTELHLTLNKGTIDFAPNFNDERSMSTFEVDRGFGSSGQISNNDETETLNDGTNPIIEPAGSLYGHNTPLHHILQLKGTIPFTPTTIKTTQNNRVCMILESSDDAYVGGFNQSRDTYFISEDYIDPTFELSFLDKDHTLIINIDKPTELFEGIGTKGIALIPEHLHGTVKSNLEGYLQKAGIIDNATNIQA